MLCIITALCCVSACAFLGGCNSNDKKTYIDCDENYNILDSELAEQIEKSAEPLNTVVSGYKYSNQYRDADLYMIDDEFMYIRSLGHRESQYSVESQQDYKIDLQTGELIPLCNVPGCEHRGVESPDCEEFFPCAITGDTYLALSQTESGYSNKIVNEDGTVIFENKFTTELVELSNRDNIDQYGDECKYYIARFFVDEKNIYILGMNYIYMVDMQSMQATEPLVVDEDFSYSCIGMDLENKKLYIQDIAYRVYVLDLNTWKITQIFDEITWNVQIHGDRLYYIRYNPRDEDDTSRWEKAALYEADLDGKNPKLVVNNCFESYAIKDGKIFYGDVDTEALRCYDMSSGEDTLIFDNWAFAINIITIDSIDRIFAISEDKNTDSVLISVKSDGSDLWVAMIKGGKTLF